MDKSRTTTRKRGANLTKLKKDEVAHIKYLIDKGFRNKDLADMYHVTPSNISSIRCGHTWREVVMRRSFTEKYLTDRGYKVLGYVGLSVVVIMAAWGMYAGLTN